MTNQILILLGREFKHYWREESEIETKERCKWIPPPPFGAATAHKSRAGKICCLAIMTLINNVNFFSRVLSIKLGGHGQLVVGKWQWYRYPNPALNNSSNWNHLTSTATSASSPVFMGLPCPILYIYKWKMLYFLTFCPPLLTIIWNFQIS